VTANYPGYTSQLTPVLDLPPQVEALVFEGEGQRLSEPCRAHFSQLDVDDQQQVIAYCMELDCLHQEFGFILEEMDESVKVLYPNSLYLKRMALIYHTDNFYFRVPAYREKVFKLVNHFLDLKIPENENKFNNEVSAHIVRLKLTQLSKLLSQFDRDRMFSRAMWLRNRIVHDLARRDWPGHWPSLEARARIDDVIFYTDKFDAWDRTTDWDRAHESKQEELGNLYKRIEQFRDELLSTLRILDYGQIQPR
jgi:HEPN superfamily protein